VCAIINAYLQSIYFTKLNLTEKYTKGVLL